MEFIKYSPSKIEEIKALFTKVFSDSEGESEGLIIGDLVHKLMTSTDEQDLYGFTVVEDEAIVGSIFFSKLTFESGINAFLLSPVAVDTKCQRKGVGQQLINFGIDHLKEDGAQLIFTYGDIKFYSKVGFGVIDEEVVKAPFTLSYPEGWLGQSLVSDTVEPIAGDSSCVEAFHDPEIW